MFNKNDNEFKIFKDLIMRKYPDINDYNKIYEIYK
jgi:hypothetical protein